MMPRELQDNYIKYLKNAVWSKSDGVFMRWKTVWQIGEPLRPNDLMVTDFISGITDSFAKNLYQISNGLD